MTWLEYVLRKAAAMLPFGVFKVCLLSLLFSSIGAQTADIWPTPKNAITKVIVLKAARKMQLWNNDKLVRTFTISLGSNPIGHKQQEGDGRTPEGNYTLDFRKDDSVAYKAIHISYPSANDIANARTKGVKPGGSIMIHGIWNGYGWAGGIMKFFDFTNGCIGLNNMEMDEVWDMLAWNTPIEIRP